MAGTNQVSLEYLEVLATTAGSNRVVTEYLEVMGTSVGTNRVQAEYLEVLASALPPSPAVSLSLGALSITVNWTAVPGATGYQVWKGTSSGGETLAATVGSGVFTMNFTGLTAGTTYFFYVIALASPLNSAPSNEAGATALASPPIQQLTPLREDGGCLVAYFGGPNKKIVWSASIGTISPLSQYTDASGVACAYFDPGGDILLEGGAGVILQEDGVSYFLLEGAVAGAIAGALVNISVQQYG